jgi:hypothetical protein
MIKAYFLLRHVTAGQPLIMAEVERRLSVVQELEAVMSANLRCAICLRQPFLKRGFTESLS